MFKLFKLKFIFAFLLVAFLAGPLCSQTKTWDSLVKVYNAGNPDSVKCNILNKFSALCTKKAEYQNALKYADSALMIAKKIKDKRKIADGELNLAQGYYHLGNYNLSASNSLKALKAFEELKAASRQAVALTLLGSVFYEQNKLDISLQYFSRALEKYKTVSDLKGISYCYNNLSLVYYFQKKIDMAIKTLEEAVRLKIENNEEDMVATSYSNLGLMYAEIGKKEKALDLYNRGLKIYARIGDDAGRALIYQNLGDFYLDEKKFEIAEHYYDTTLKLAVKTKYLDYEKAAYGGLAKVCEKSGKFHDALQYYEHYILIKDSLVNTENSKNINELQTRYETEKKDKDNKLLQAQNEISLKTINQQKTTTYFILTGLILVIGLAFFIFRGLKQQRRANKIITEQKHLVEEKQNEIVDSIKYARRIQQSLLPTEKYIERKLKKKT
ncbi:MAG TPA: tetratricopeptide repeat protein [Bacteroidia bacterium]|jgi:tetratricopeptide (TPR) repeat protein|nr:tetratricopeptide repeat protein [Bacteroidia bacterium]